jgi:hypothetical protein
MRPASPSSTTLASAEETAPSLSSRGETSADEERIILVIATRIHLGQVRQFCQMVQDIASNFQPSITVQGVVAVDAARKPANQGGESKDLVAEVHRGCCVSLEDPAMVRVLPVQPWGKFVPALNALLSYAVRLVQQAPTAAPKGVLLFVSLETIATPASVQILLSHLNYADTLVCGAVLPGHEYHGPSKPDATANSVPLEPTAVTLNGLTSPWNTLALWNVSKLSLTGFLAVSEGLHDDPTIAGIEEVAVVATLQKLFPPQEMKAKLIALSSSVQWDTASLAQDPARQAWHATKMQSKRSRAAQQLVLLQNLVGGIVRHY